MPRTNSNDPLRTTDQVPTAATEGPDVSTDHPSGSPLAFEVTSTQLPGHGVGLSGTPPASVPASVTIPGYQIEGVLGRGAMGVVYKAHHLALKRRVAVKMVLAGAHAGPHQLARFRNEAEAVARLQHPNIVQIHEVGEVGGHPYCALEFVEGGNLAGKLDGKPLSASEAARLVESLARAMQLAHSRNVVHRDLKPANILLTADGTPKITDFGLARQTDRDSGETQAGAVMGTPSYMAPEQAAGRAHEAGPAADVYALGAILYHCLAGRPPFQGKSVVETLDRVRTLEPTAPSRSQAGVPLDLDTICLKCLRKEPEHRYASAAELADELVRYQRGEPILARPVRHIERAIKWVKRNPVEAGAVVAVVLALAVGTTVSSLKYRDAERQKEIAEEKRQAADRATAEALRERQAERWERYRSNLIAAGSAMQLHNVSAARGALDAAPEEHRGWEWQHFSHQLDTAQSTLHMRISAAEPRFSADGGMVAFNAPENTLKVWDLRGRKELVSLRNTAGGGTFCFSRDGKLLAHARTDHAIELWDLAANRARAILRGHEKRVTNLEFNPASTLLATTDENQTIRIWDAVTGKQQRDLRGHEAAVVRVSFSPDGQRLISAGDEDRTARIWNLGSGETTAILSGHAEPVTFTRFSTLGDRVLTVEFFPSNNLRLWDAGTGKLLSVLKGHTNEVRCIEFSADGSRIATGSFDQTVRLWDGRTGDPVATLPGHVGWIKAVAFSPDNKRLASASQDQTVRLWDAANGAMLGILHGHTTDVSGVAYSADGSTLTSVSIDGDVRWWDARLAERNGVLRGHTSFVYGVAFHPDGERVASASWDGSVRIWNATTGERLRLLKYPDKTFVTSVSFHPSGKLLATLGRDDAVRVWDVESGTEVRRLKAPTKSWMDSRVTFSPRGDRLACGGFDDAVHVWDCNSWAEVAVLRGHKHFIRDVAFAPDGTWLASSSEVNDPTIRIWDVVKSEQVQLLEGHSGGVYALAVSPDGKWLASGSFDGTVRLWDTATWKEVTVLKHGVNIYGMAFTPDGARLACACGDNTVRLWDMATHKAVAELNGHGAYVHQIAWSPDGTRLVSASGDSTIRVWDSLSTSERVKRSADLSPAR